MFHYLTKFIFTIAKKFNWVAAASVTAMMLLTCADVILRIFRCPIPGTYEIVGLLGAVFVSFSLAHTSMERGHIAVNFLVEKFSKKIQKIIDGINSLICSVLFALITWQSVIYAQSLKEAGEVSLTLQIPIYPFIYGISIGCGMLSIVLFTRCLGLFITTRNPELKTQ
ncbi:TRAP transporter small permease [Candidatus Magnetomoraceae bacterium gMMP-15]